MKDKPVFSGLNKSFFNIPYFELFKKLYPILLVIISCNLFAYRDVANVIRVTQSFSRFGSNKFACI